jgi:hypothetical protein
VFLEVHCPTNFKHEKKETEDECNEHENRVYYFCCSIETIKSKNWIKAKIANKWLTTVIQQN